MKRNFLFAWYQTPRGKLLKELEVEHIKRSITVSCKHTVLQIGGLGWEDEFVDCSLYKNYTILDAKCLGSKQARKIQAKSNKLPLQNDSVDMVILPHMLEFDASRFQTMREVERVLKPEGILLVINFNPLSLWVRYQYLWDIKMSDSWGSHFISRSRLLDWLKLLSFEVAVSSEFGLDTVKSTYGSFTSMKYSVTSTAYAIKAIKRRYNLIPLTPVAAVMPKLVVSGPINASSIVDQNE